MTVNETFENNVIAKTGEYRLFAIDGTDLRLPESDAIWSEFSAISGSRLPHARASFSYNVTSGYIIDARFVNITVDERTMALQHLKSNKAVSKTKRFNYG